MKLSDECIICGAPLEYLEQPEEILERMMSLPMCHMHGPEHVHCSRSAKNNQCRGTECPFHVPEFRISIC